MTTRRNELARCLADIEPYLAKAEEMSGHPEDHGERQAGLDFLIEFQDAKRRVISELSRE